MSVVSQKVRFNYLAIAVAALANFVLEAVWYSVFMNQWLSGIGHDRAWLMNSGVGPSFQYIQFLTAYVSAFFVAMGISWVLQKTGGQSAARGIKYGIVLWFFFMLADHATGDVFALVPMASFLVNAGFWLVGMSIMGLIVGAWTAKTK